MYCKIIENVKRKKSLLQTFKATKKAKLNTFNPIPTGCCHVTLIYGLIPPMAGRNRVKNS